MTLEGVDVTASHDQLRRQVSETPWVHGEVAHRTGGRCGGGVDRYVRDRVSSPGRVVDMVLEVVPQELRDVLAAFHDHTDDVALGSRQQLGIRIRIFLIEVADIRCKQTANLALDDEFADGAQLSGIGRHAILLHVDFDVAFTIKTRSGHQPTSSSRAPVVRCCSLKRARFSGGCSV